MRLTNWFCKATLLLIVAKQQDQPIKGVLLNGIVFYYNVSREEEQK
jgi:hypothetical protein